MSTHVDNGSIVSIDLVFHNTSSDEQVLLFSNRSRKAELLGLSVIAADGSTISPEAREMILLRKVGLDKHAIPWNGSWNYTLTGSIQGEYLEFQGAAYRILGNSFISLRFRYAGVESNLATFKV